MDNIFVRTFDIIRSLNVPWITVLKKKKLTEVKGQCKKHSKLKYIDQSGSLAFHVNCKVVYQTT